MRNNGSRLLMACLLLAGVAGWRNPAEEFEAREYKDASGARLLYRLFKPKEIAGGAKIPMVLFLHGAGERGDDNKAQLKHCVRRYVEQQAKYPCLVVAPQCPKGQKWADVNWGAQRHSTTEKPSEPMRLTIKLLEALQKEFPVDPKRIYVSGLSMGGYGTWEILVRRPDLFAAAVPVCGGGDEKKAKLIAKIPQWIFHGGSDRVVPTARSQRMVAALKAAGGSPKYTEYPGVGHNSWNLAYAEKDLFPWLFGQRRP